MRGTLGRRAAIAWAREKGLTPQRLWPALRERGGVEGLLSTGEEELARLLGSAARARALRRAPEDGRSERWALEIERSGISLLTAFDEEYPRPLKEIADPPLLLFALGHLERLRSPAVAVVGSRNATRYGREVSSRLGGGLSAVGVSVVSGLARGVDAAAHEAALEGPGGTIAVLGCGLDVDYPRENARLKDEIARLGVVLSEFPPGSEPLPQNFPIRNRIIAGLSAGVVVVEASRRSGSLITARLAADFGRDVFAVPGSVFSETSTGAHELLRDGAILCRGVEDIFAELFPALTAPAALPLSSPPAPPPELSAEARQLFDALREETSCSAEELVRSTEMPAAVVLAALFELEGAGLAAESDGHYSLVRR
ncbi:MAG: DNA-processing protein DprA [Thermoanaerobaculia bacterium]